jgi:hypothetical protein
VRDASYCVPDTGGEAISRYPKAKGNLPPHAAIGKADYSPEMQNSCGDLSPLAE